MIPQPLLALVAASTAIQLVGAAAEWDLSSDTWSATDALGRSLPSAAETGPPRPDRTVGIFYFLWHGAHIQGGPFDVSRILAQDPAAMDKPESPLWGPLHAPHHWGESIFGYYLTNDEGVLRKHAQMLSDAGVDVVIFDVTNQVTYPDYYRVLLRVWSEFRQLGNRTPQVAFLAPFWDPSKVVAELWRDLYMPGSYPDLWFRWEGKPLMLADPDLFANQGEHSARIREFFTFRRPQPDYFKGPTKPDMWGWLEVHPQHVFINARGEKEQMTVGVAQNAVGDRLGCMSETGARGRSFHSGAVDARPNAVDYGYNVAEQWDRALAENPRFIFITGWNEWIAGRFNEFNGVRLPVMFVDQFDQEHSRDIEPMRGGHGDNYYYQMVAFIRRYKGTRPLLTVAPRAVRIDGKFDDWREVEPEFRDTIGDPACRRHRGWDPTTIYENQSRRNDIVAAKISADHRNLWFNARTREPFDPASGPPRTFLFIDLDRNARTGWLGYDFVVNRSGTKTTSASIEKNVGGRYVWRSVGKAALRFAGNELELGIPRRALELDGPLEQIDFKWADNIAETGDWSDFTLNGDVAPNDRFNYRARFDKPKPK